MNYDTIPREHERTERDRRNEQARRDRSAGWREEYRDQGVLLPDGGTVGTEAGTPPADPYTCPVCGEEGSRAGLAYHLRNNCPGTAGDQAVTDGGRVRLTEGATVRDRDSDDDDDLLEVVEVHRNERADGWHIDAIGETVAKANPDYPPGDPVVVCVYREDVLDRFRASAGDVNLQTAASHGELRTYTFPRSRLRATGGDQQ